MKSYKSQQQLGFFFIKTKPDDLYSIKFTSPIAHAY